MGPTGRSQADANADATLPAAPGSEDELEAARWWADHARARGGAPVRAQGVVGDADGGTVLALHLAFSAAGVGLAALPLGPALAALAALSALADLAGVELLGRLALRPASEAVVVGRVEEVARVRVAALDRAVVSRRRRRSVAALVTLAGLAVPFADRLHPAVPVLVGLGLLVAAGAAARRRTPVVPEAGAPEARACAAALDAEAVVLAGGSARGARGVRGALAWYGCDPDRTVVEWVCPPGLPEPPGLGALRRAGYEVRAVRPAEAP